MKRRLLIVVWIVSFLVVGCGAQPKEEPTPTPIPTSVVPEKPTYVVQRGTVEKKVQFTARVSPLSEEDLYFKTGGYVDVVYVDKGDWVEEGTILAELEVDDLLNQLALVQLDLESAEKAYESAVEAHERQLYSAQMNLDTLQLRLERAKAQAPMTDFTSLRLGVERASEALEEARVAYKEALDRPWEAQRLRDSLFKNVANAERNYEEAQARYRFAVQQADQAEQIYELDLKLLEKEIEKAEKELEWLQRGVDPALAQRVESAGIQVERLEAQVESAQLIAPFNGEITSLTAIPGKAVEARKPVAVIADPRDIDITAELLSKQMDLLEEGMQAQVTLSRAPGQVFEANIQLLPYPYGTGGGSVKVEDMDPRTHIALLDPEQVDLEVGDLVKVTVLVEQSDDAIYLPPAAIRTFEGRKFVMVRAGDRLQKVDVKLGIEGEDRVEVLEGLEEGQVVEGL
jgi:RND family efflux transporter MFP subunit